MSYDSNNVISLISICIQADVPSMLIGDPGEGKTAVFSSVADNLGLNFESITAALFGPEDAGIPIPGEGNKCRRLFDEHFINAAEKPTLFLIDELTRANSRAGFNSLLRILQEKRIAGLTFNPGTRFIATANPDTTDSGCMPIPSALSNRIAWFQGEIEREDWIKWMLTGVGGESKVIRLPANWADYIPDARGKVLAFTQAMPQLLKDIPKNSDTPGAYPTRRSWTNAATLYGAAIALKDKTIGYNLVRATVGAGPAQAFHEWINKADLPDPSDVLDNIGTYTFPNRYDLKWAISTACASEALRRNTTDGWNKLEKMILKLAAMQSKDIGAYAVSIMFANREKWTKVYTPSRELASTYVDIVMASDLLK